MNPLKYRALKTILEVSYEIAIGKRGEDVAIDNPQSKKTHHRQKQDN